MSTGWRDGHQYECPVTITKLLYRQIFRCVNTFADALQNEHERIFVPRVVIFGLHHKVGTDEGKAQRRIVIPFINVGML